jgi:hypothetical protein
MKEISFAIKRLYLTVTEKLIGFMYLHTLQPRKTDTCRRILAKFLPVNYLRRNSIPEIGSWAFSSVNYLLIFFAFCNLSANELAKSHRLCWTDKDRCVQKNQQQKVCKKIASCDRRISATGISVNWAPYRGQVHLKMRVHKFPNRGRSYDRELQRQRC